MMVEEVLSEASSERNILVLWKAESWPRFNMRPWNELMHEGNLHAYDLSATLKENGNTSKRISS